MLGIEQVDDVQQDNSRPHYTWSITIFHTYKELITTKLDEIKEHISRGVACRDQAPTTGEEHFHIAITFKTTKRFNAVKAIFGEQAHIKWTVGEANIKHLFNYVSGEGDHADFKEIIWEHNNVRTKKIKSGKKFAFYQEWRKYRTLNHYYALIQKPEWAEFNTEYKHIVEELNLSNREKHLRKWPRKIVWVCGDTGAGKSRMAHTLMEKWTEYFPYDHAGEVSASVTSGQLFGIQGDENMILIDDIKTDKMQTQDVLKLLDTYPQPQDVKGSWAHYDPDLVMVTCMKAPDNLGDKWDQDNQRQLARRITYIINVRPQPDGSVRYIWYNQAHNQIADTDLDGTVTALLQEVKGFVQQYQPVRLGENPDPDEQVLPH